MANITLNATTSNINVTTTSSVISVSDDTGPVTNVITQSSNVIISSSPLTLTIAETAAISNAEIRQSISNTSPILYNVATGVIGFDANAAFSNSSVLGAIQAGNVKLKEYSETLYETFGVSGNITANIQNGTIHKFNLVGNVTGINFQNLTTGGGALIILAQDIIGGHALNTTTFASNWTNWQWSNNDKEINTNAGGYTLISVINQGSNQYVATINKINATSLIPNSSFANSNVIVNGTTISLGSSGNISNFGNLTTANLSESGNLYFTTARARQSISGTGDISYDSNTGVISYIGTPGDITDVIAGSGLTGGGSSGNVTLNVGAGTGITVNADNIAVNMSAFTTTDLVEGANLYFTTGRANTAIGAYQGSINTTGNVTAGYFSGNGSLLTGLYSNSNVQQYLALGFGSNNINTTGNVTAGYFIGNGSQLTGMLTNAQVVAYIATQPLTVGGNLTVNGNINATGNINYQNVTDLYVTDQKITLNSNAATNSNVEIISNRPTATNVMLKWNEQATRWEFTNNGTTYYPIPTSTTDLAEGSNLWFTTARANSAMDSYLIGGTGISYTSGTIALDFTEFSTSNIAEGSNLYYSNARVNSFIQDNITTTDIDEGTNLYFTAARARGNISAAENLTYSNSTGIIGMANTLANVNGVSSETAANLTLTTNKQITVTTRQRNNDLTNSINITGEGFALSQTTNLSTAPFFTYSGTEQLKTIGINGNATLGSNVITVTSLRDMQNNPLTISNVTPYMAFTDQPTLAGATTIFPPGTYVVSASGSNIFMSANCIDTEPLNFDPASPYTNSFGGLSPAAYDATTGLLVALESNFDGGGANAQLIDVNFLNNQDLKYGYGPNGPIPSNFVYSIGTSSNYSINTSVISNFMFGRTDFSADQTVVNFRRGVTIGDADLTNRGENDGLQTFGLNIVWDGTANSLTDYGTSSGIFPQILLKQYTAGTGQATSLSNSGPRMLFIGANGKNTDAPLTTYARNNQELGRISWLSTTALSATPGSTSTPAYISVVANKDQTNGPGGIGMYLVAAPTDSSLGTVNAVGGVTARQLWAAAHKGNTIISAGAPFNNNSGNVIFAPARQGLNEGNAVLLAQRIVDSACASPHWSTIGYDVPTSNTGARISVTNGHNTTAGRNGNLSVALNRRDNGAGFGTKEWALKIRSGQTDLVLTEDGAIRTTFAGANITTSGNISASTFLGNISGATGTFTGNVDVTGNINLTGRLLGYDRVYGEFAYTAGNIVPAAADTILAFPLDTTLINSDVIANNTSRINITKSGFYKLFSSIQIKNADNVNNHIFRFWLRKNGADVANSATLITPLKQQEQVVSMHWMVESDGDDYWEIMYYVNDTNVTFPYYGTIASPVTAPAAPPIIVNVIPVGA